MSLVLSSPAPPRTAPAQRAFSRACAVAPAAAAPRRLPPSAQRPRRAYPGRGFVLVCHTRCRRLDNGSRQGTCSVSAFLGSLLSKKQA